MNISQEFILKNFGDKINKLKVRMAQHIADGGSLYDPKRQRPYYDYLDYVYHGILKYDETFTHTDLHQLCGFEYDTEYNEYLILMDMLKQHSDENNFVDSVKKSKGVKSPKTLLQKFATDMGVSPSDYLILMTDYRYAENAYIKLGNNPNLSYLHQLEVMTREVYPVGSNATGLKREYPHIYEGMRHFIESGLGYEMGIFSMADLADYLKITNENFSTHAKRSEFKKYEVFKKIRKLYPDGNIDNITKEHPTEYFQLARIARQEGVFINDLCKEGGLTYTIGQEVKRLGRMQVDPKRREKELSIIKNNLLSQYDQSKLESPVARYRFKKQIAQKTMEIINNPVSTQ